MSGDLELELLIFRDAKNVSESAYGKLRIEIVIFITVQPLAGQLLLLLHSARPTKRLCPHD